MARKVFISVLGAGFYAECVYGKDNFYGADKHFRSSKTRFVQQATLEFLNAKEWAETDAAYILTTKKAIDVNWKECICERQRPYSEVFEHYVGLQRVIKDMNLPFKEATAVEIPDGVNEEEIWKIFEILTTDDVGKQIIQEGDELYFDLTHGFRYLPMLVLVLGNYAKFLKKVKKCSITYGNFEMKDAQGIAPIIDLLPLAALQDWTYAVADYLENGYTEQLEMLSKDSLTPILSNQGNLADEALKEHAKILKSLVGSIKNVADERQTCRGISVTESNSVKQLKANIIKTEQSVIKPLTPLISQVNSSLASFDEGENVLNAIAAARWCFDNHQYQSATTFLEEGTISFFCHRHQINYKDESLRSLIPSAINIKVRKIPKEEWIIEESRVPLLVRILDDPMFLDKELVNCFNDFVSLRNDYNHCGFRLKERPLSAPKMIAKIKRAITLIENKLQNAMPIEGILPKVGGKTVLINLTNHPSSSWGDAQVQAAESYGEIIDIPFPDIAPDDCSEGIEALVEEYVNKILDRPEFPGVIVHVMGEMTFTYQLVSRLKDLGVECVASTTERVVTEEGGKKISEFRFVQFREY